MDPLLGPSKPDICGLMHSSNVGAQLQGTAALQLCPQGSQMRLLQASARHSPGA